MNARFVISQVKADLGLQVGVRETTAGLEHTAITADHLGNGQWLAVVQHRLYSASRPVEERHKTLVYDKYGPVN